MLTIITNQYAQLAVIYLVVLVLMLPPHFWRWPHPEELAALLWPLVFAALLLAVLIGLSFLAWDKANAAWGARHG